eukprot:CAMPEP_0194567258 /NCGR_PEP_ID=MMETSP0292-20121207/5798_1 /TAXON_ID=39354 /ORGANISM="Heterosigma akashiwo, Strain CCMP2393" /LENGTH=55 /DNA_ID=CAMNT_0039416977 /DNA_START=738 /DNA_END=905 /DNA_ORIENTATION=-
MNHETILDQLFLELNETGRDLRHGKKKGPAMLVLAAAMVKGGVVSHQYSVGHLSE